MADSCFHPTGYAKTAGGRLWSHRRFFCGYLQEKQAMMYNPPTLGPTELTTDCGVGGHEVVSGLLSILSSVSYTVAASSLGAS